MQRLQASQQTKQGSTHAVEIMQKQAAVLIDGENIAATYANSLHNFLLATLSQQQAFVQELDLFGTDDVLRHWQAISRTYPFRSHTNHKSRNVADHIMQQEAPALADHGVRLFYLVSNDGGFAQTVSSLYIRGCHVICLGNALSRKLKAVCSDFFILTKSANTIKAIRPDNTHGPSSQGEQPMNDTFASLHDHNPFAFAIADPPSPNDIQSAIQLLYHSPLLPAYFSRLLHLFVEQTFRALYLTEQES